MPHRSAAVCAIYLLFSAPALCDVTAQDVWDSWQDSARLFGKDLSVASKETTETGLLLRGVVGTFAPHEMIDLEITIDRLSLDEENGTVVISYGDQIGMKIEMAQGGFFVSSMTGTVAMTDADIRAMGDPGAIDYQYRIPRIEAQGTNTVTSPDGVHTGQMDSLMTNLVGQIENWPGTIDQPSTSQQSIDAYGYKMTTTDPNGVKNVAEYLMDDIQAETTYRPTKGEPIPYEIVGTSEIGLARQSTLANIPGGKLTFTSTTQSSQYGVQLANKRLSFDMRSQDTRMGISAIGIPMPPLDFQMAAVTMDVDIPIGLGPEPAPFEVSLKLDAFEPADSVWAQFDPNGHIDRSPGEFAVDLSGNVAGNTNAPSAPEMAVTTPVFAPLTIQSLRLGLGGALLTGAGELLLSPSLIRTEAEGRLSFTLDNGLALLRGLVQAGVIPQDKLMGMQMMLGMIAKPDGDGDRLISNIDVGPGERLVVNGTQIR